MAVTWRSWAARAQAMFVDHRRLTLTGGSHEVTAINRRGHPPAALDEQVAAQLLERLHGHRLAVS